MDICYNNAFNLLATSHSVVLYRKSMDYTSLCDEANELFNPLSTTGLLTPVLIGSYHDLFTGVINYDKALKMLHAQTCACDYFFLHLF